MSRIVAGQAGGRLLRVPAKGTRPTSERVREAVFSRLEHTGAVAGARVLDLYAGSGALGLEAMSRGADGAVLVESGKDAARICRANAAALGLAARVEVVAARVETFLGGRSGGQESPGTQTSPVTQDSKTSPGSQTSPAESAGPTSDHGFDLVFLDPPYDLADDALAAVLDQLARAWLTPGAVVVVERSRRAAEPRWPASLGPGTARGYGDTAVWFATVDG